MALAMFVCNDIKINTSINIYECQHYCLVCLMLPVWIVHTRVSFLFSFNFIYNPLFVPCLVCLMLPVSLDCTFSSVTLVFFQLYLQPTVCPVSCLANVTSVSVLSILECHSCFLSILFTTHCLSRVSSA